MASDKTVHQNKLILELLPMVENVVNGFKGRLPAHIDFDDLHSVGVLGLIAACRNHDPKKNSTFNAYAYTRIRGAILDELRRLDPTPRRARGRNKKLQVEINAVNQKLGRDATDQEMADHLGLTSGEYTKHVREACTVTVVAMDKVTTEDGQTLHDLLADNIVSPADSVDGKNLREVMRGKIEQLPDMMRRCLTMTYYQWKTPEQISEVLGVTTSRICQINLDAVKLLRRQMTTAISASPIRRVS